MNEEQIAFWNGPAAQRWTAHQRVLDRSLQVFGRAALEAGAAQTGESVLDVGCGCGDSLIALAASVGSAGQVTGIDISAQMLARARERTAPLANVKLIEADAAKLPDVAAFDLIHSRFGVMFFDEPVGAFARLRGALRPQGRIAFVCWRTLQDNPWSRLPLEIIRDAWPDAPPPYSTGPGPFALAEHARLSEVMRGGGFSQIRIERFDAPVVLSPDALEEAVEYAVCSGPAARLLAGASPEVLQRSREGITRLLQSQRSAHGYGLEGSTWIVTARA